ncbi:MAG: CpsD/CapB family tyrosine-protein kinase [Candidatus Krumholzibacteriia bacterium]|nr:CpsD/CapB family tyrosine-protein kinase [Candidatus Latescibacterota bacterium]MCB9516630.1 CpsD/CapB family tyrosine-protein kinase [Candidatus Latescibacterota bacterium]
MSKKTPEQTLPEEQARKREALATGGGQGKVAGKAQGGKPRRERASETIPGTEGEPRSIYAVYQEESPVAVEFRRSYAKLSYHMKQENKHCFLMTSAMEGEGKSTAAAMMAMTIARYRNSRTLLLDADLRRPRVHEFFELPARDGFADALLGERDIIDTIKDTRVENLKVITCGKRVASPTGLLQADKLSAIISELKFYFDTVILDSPPVLPVSDAAQIAGETDGVIFVVMAGVTQRDVVKRAVDILRDSRIEVLGALVNNASQVLPYYYSYDYYDYRY